jgi:NitT/TauT family transport system permease protein
MTTVSLATIGRRRAGRTRSAVRNGYPMVVVGLLGLILWEAVVKFGNVPTYLIPAPSAIVSAFIENHERILSASQITALAVVGGMVLGASVGVAVSFLITLFERTASTSLALLAFLSCAPVVALAPIFNAWFGVTNLMSKIAVAAIMVFFPVVVNTTRGLLSVTPIHRELMESLSASRWQVMAWVRIPGALPGFLDGLKIGATLSVIGIIVSEYFGGSTNALGVLIANTAALSQFAQTWAAVAAASFIGLAVYGVVLLIERLVAPWRGSEK